MSRTISLKAALILAVGVVVGTLIAPSAVSAASSVFTIVGPGHEDEASGVRVKNGKLQVSDGSGVLTVDGTVNAVPAAPTHPWHYGAATAGDGALVPIFNPPAGTTTLAIGSITFQNDTAGILFGALATYSADNCFGDEQSVDYQSYLQPHASAQATFPIPLVVDLSGGRSLCLAGAWVGVQLQGYYY